MSWARNFAQVLHSIGNCFKVGRIFLGVNHNRGFYVIITLKL